MKVAAFYSGYTRTWDKVQSNQAASIGPCDKYFYTFESPGPCWQWIRIPQHFYPYLPDHPYIKNKNPYSSVDSTLNQWHNQFVGFNLIPNTYDIYVKSRCDIELGGNIDFAQYEINDTNIYIPKHNDHYEGVNDQFAFGSYSVMKKYCSVYINHRDIFDSGMQFHPEGYVTRNMKNLGLNIIRLNITNTIVR